MKRILREIIEYKKREVAATKSKTPITHFVNAKGLLRGIRPFKEAIAGGNGVSLIAEIKKKSPSSRRDFIKRLDVERLAKIYKEGGAKAISVITDKRYFGGDLSYIAMVRRAVDIPVLRKDFIVDEYQIYESRYYGADAILLIARILDFTKLKSFMHLAKRIGLETLIEVHDEKDLDKASHANAKMIGINNRNLDTLHVSTLTTYKLVPKIPREIVKVSESGIKTHEEILKLLGIGVNSVLIGETFLSAGDIRKKMKEVMEGG